MSKGVFNFSLPFYSGIFFHLTFHHQEFYPAFFCLDVFDFLKDDTLNTV